MVRADLVLHGGRMWTGDPENPSTHAAAVVGGRIVAVGDEAAAMAPSAHRAVDLGGRRVVPGLHDSHVHAVRAGPAWRRAVRWDETRSLRDGLALLAARAAETPAGSWVAVVGGWHSRQLAEGRAADRAELDGAAPNHPVLVQMLYDEAVLNSAGLAACGWTSATPDPPGGRLERDVAGALTGRIFGVGAFALPQSLALAVDHDEAVAGTRAMMRELASHGLTGIIDGAGFSMSPESYGPLYDVWRSGDMPLRVRLYLSPWTSGAERAEVDELVRFVRPGFGDEMLAVVGLGEVAHFGCHDMEGLDGVASTSAMWEEFEEITRTCLSHGWPMSIHAVLDSTLSRVLDAWEAASAALGGLHGRRFSIVHADEASPRNVERMAALGLGVLVQSRLLLKASDYVDAWGQDAVHRAPPLGDFREHGIVVGAGTDAMRANWFGPWPALWWLVTGGAVDGSPRRAPEHRLSREEALRAYTAGGAWFTGEEYRRGRIATGFDADLCVPTMDLLACAEDELLDIRSALTVMGGRVTHASGPFAGLENGPGAAT